MRIPEPSVLYRRPSTNTYWEKPRSEAIANHIKNIRPNIINLKDVQNTLQQISKAEKDKEDLFLQKFYFDYNNNSLTHTEKINDLFQTKEYTDRINDRLQEIFNHKQNSFTASSNGKKNWTGMAPNLNSVFMSYIYKALKEKLVDFYNDLKSSGNILNYYQNNPNALQPLIDKYIMDSIQLATYYMAFTINKSIYGEKGDFTPIYQILTEDQRVREIFRKTALEILGENNFDSLLIDLIKHANKKKPLEKEDIAGFINANFQGVFDRRQMRQGGGKMLEASLVAMFEKQLQGKTADGTIKYKARATRLGGPSTMTDVQVLFSEKDTIDLEKIEKLIIETMTKDTTTTNMNEIWKKLEKMHRKYKAIGLEQVYTVFINAKNNNPVGKNATNPRKSYEGSMESLPSFLTGLGLNQYHISETDFLWSIYNLGTGAIKGPIANNYTPPKGTTIITNQEKDFIQPYTYALSAMAAKMMFDDYIDIGVKDSKSVHLYYLSGKYIPASTIFSLMAKALEKEELSRYAKVSFTLPKPIKDYGADNPNNITEGWKEGLGLPEKTPDKKFKEALYQHWNDEIEMAKKASSWKVTFILHLKEILEKSVDPMYGNYF